jgi:hypothetical protein
MGQTNYHRVSALLERAGFDFEDQGVLQNHGVPVYSVYLSFPQEDIDALSWRIRFGHVGEWASTESRTTPNTGPCVVEPPQPIPRVPKLCISHGLKDFSRNNYSRNPEAKVDMENLSYLLIVQGLSGATKQMLEIKHDLHSLAAFIVGQGLNGYSVTFSAAIPRSIARSILDGKDTCFTLFNGFKKAKDVKELLDSSLIVPLPSSQGKKSIPILC